MQSFVSLQKFHSIYFLSISTSTDKPEIIPFFMFMFFIGGYISLAGVTATLSSPIINTHDYEWKCFRFRYLIGSIHFHQFDIHFLKVIIRSVTSNQSMQLFFDDKVTNELHYVQIPIPSNYSNAQVGYLSFSVPNFDSDM